MRAIAVTEPGGLEVLRVVDRPVREPGPGEVRVAVKAAAVNPTDIGLRQRGVEGLEAPWVPGMDAAGTVESLGEGVERFAVGDAVMAAVSPRRPEGGAQAELIVVPAASVVPVPDDASFQQAATLPMNGLTAMLGLELLGLAAGQTLAVSGGAGVLASYVIALAKARDVRVIADAKPDDEALVRSFGADVVLPRGEGFPAAVRDVAPEASKASSTRRCSGAVPSRRSATAVRWPSCAAGTAAIPSVTSRSTRSGCAPSSSEPTGSWSFVSWPRRDASRCASQRSTRLSRRPRRSERWKPAGSAAAPFSSSSASAGEGAEGLFAGRDHRVAVRQEQEVEVEAEQ
jgi:threonine dehydrogenase-like Zn-dependent dehydrogenase